MALNVPTSESSLAVADQEQITSQSDWIMFEFWNPMPPILSAVPRQAANSAGYCWDC
jgi:hypothetical protein